MHWLCDCVVNLDFHYIIDIKAYLRILDLMSIAMAQYNIRSSILFLLLLVIILSNDMYITTSYIYTSGYISI